MVADIDYVLYKCNSYIYLISVLYMLRGYMTYMYVVLYATNYSINELHTRVFILVEIIINS